MPNGNAAESSPRVRGSLAAHGAPSAEPTPAAGHEVIFRREGTSKVLGALVYLVAGPFLAVIIGFIALGVTVGLLRGLFNVNEHVTTAVGIAAGALGMMASLAWALHDFRRQAAVDIVLRPSSLSYRFGRRVRTWSASEIAGIRLVNAGTQVVIDLESGGRLLLLKEIAPPHAVLPHLNRLLVPALVDRLEGRLAAGETIVIRDLGLRALPVACRELLRLAVAGLAILSMHFGGDGARQLSVALTGLRQCKRGLRGGFVLRPDGLQAAPGEPVIPYGGIVGVRTDVAGLVIETMRSPMHASVSASHYCELRAFLLRRTSPATPDTPDLQPVRR